MARPRKAETEEMIQIVDSYFTSEAAGDPSKLRYSLLEEFATRTGRPIKAYDLRRNPKVRERIEELKEIVLNENGMQMIQGNAYKSLDIDRILKARRDQEELRIVLGELDDYWRQVYERSVSVSDKNKEFQKQIRSFSNTNSDLELSFQELNAKAQEAFTANSKLMVENRYLRKMLRTYLYPALANEILQQENLIKGADTQVTNTAKEKLIDGNFPSGFVEGASGDVKSITKEDMMLTKMWEDLNDI